jgi:hypothetical protein
MGDRSDVCGEKRPKDLIATLKLACKKGDKGSRC